MRGCRESMEDAFVIEPLDGLPNHCFLAILDGHAGSGAANIASKKIREIFCQTKQWKQYVNETLDNQLTSGNSYTESEDDDEHDEHDEHDQSSPKTSNGSDDSNDNLDNVSNRERSTSSSKASNSSENSRDKVDNVPNRERSTSSPSTSSVGKRKRDEGYREGKIHKRSQSPSGCTGMKSHVPCCDTASFLLSKIQLESLSEGLRDAYIAMDKYLLECESMDTSGSTLVCAVITPAYILCANVGDSRAIISCAGGTAHALSADHKPDNAEERARIERAGSFVAIERVNGELAMSRALGDFQYKQAKHMDISQQAVTCVPEVTFHTRVSTDGILVLACDGVWDVLSNQEVVSFVWDHLIAHDKSITMEEAAEAVVNLSLRQGSSDNISAIVCLLNPSQIAVDNEKIASCSNTGGTPVRQNDNRPPTELRSSNDYGDSADTDANATDGETTPHLRHRKAPFPSRSPVF
jgi:serine/threonine protein phosphatase PrpC